MGKHWTAMRVYNETGGFLVGDFRTWNEEVFQKVFPDGGFVYGKTDTNEGLLSVFRARVDAILTHRRKHAELDRQLAAEEAGLQP